MIVKVLRLIIFKGVELSFFIVGPVAIEYCYFGVPHWFLRITSMIKQLGCLVFLCVVASASFSEAALTLRINGSTTPAAINITQGQQTTLQISLAGTTPDVPSDPLNNNFAQNIINLDSFGFRLETSSNIAIASAVINPALSLTSSSISGNGTTAVTVSGLFNSANRPDLANANALLATITISTPGPGNTTILLRDPNTAAGNLNNNTTTHGAGVGPFARDADIFAQANGGLSNVSVNLVIAVPEPSSMLLLAAAGIAVVGFSARRKLYS